MITILAHIQIGNNPVNLKLMASLLITLFKLVFIIPKPGGVCLIGTCDEGKSVLFDISLIHTFKLAWIFWKKTNNISYFTSDRWHPPCKQLWGTFPPIDIQSSTISFLCLFVEVVVVFLFYSSSLECEKGGLGTGRVSSGQILIK